MHKFKNLKIMITNLTVTKHYYYLNYLKKITWKALFFSVIHGIILKRFG